MLITFMFVNPWNVIAMTYNTRKKVSNGLILLKCDGKEWEIVISPFLWWAYNDTQYIPHVRNI